MSVNRSVQAAQRRRAGPTNAPEPPRGPSTSINSAQMFASQVRAGPGPNIPPGRMAAQQMSQSQQARMQQQQVQQQQQQQVQEDAGFSKMTIAQAITLITLRLGKVEQSVMDIEHREPGMSYSGSTSSIDDSTVQSIMSRLESLERRPTSSPDVSLLKQQIESMKPTIAQYKTSSANLSKENGELRSEINMLKGEVEQLREIIETLRMEMDALVTIPAEDDNVNLVVEEQEHQEMNPTPIEMDGLEENTLEFDPPQETMETSEIVGTDLKQMIEQELNSSTIEPVEVEAEAEVEVESFATIRQKKNRRR